MLLDDKKKLLVVSHAGHLDSSILMRLRMRKFVKYLVIKLAHYSKLREFCSALFATLKMDLEPKSKCTVFIDFLYIFFVLKRLPTNYFLFHFHQKSRSQFREYLGETTEPIVNNLFYRNLWDTRYDSLVNDKYLFYCYCRCHKIPVPQLYSHYLNGQPIHDNNVYLNSSKEQQEENVVVKPARGIEGHNVVIINKSNPTAISEECINGHFVSQEYIKQHEKFAEINPHCVNTIRIITFLTREKKVEFLAAILRTSADQTPIDNFVKGGIAVGIDLEKGKLKQYGRKLSCNSTFLARHPLTGLRFEQFLIPYWDEIKKMAADAQKVLFQLKTIGWDFAVSDNGPLIIEGNVEWGTTGIQAANGGLLTKRNRKLFAQYGIQFP